VDGRTGASQVEFKVGGSRRVGCYGERGRGSGGRASWAKGRSAPEADSIFVLTYSTHMRCPGADLTEEIRQRRIGLTFDTAVILSVND